MEYLIDKRASGRTTRLIEWCKEKPETRCLVVMDSREENRINDLTHKEIFVLNIHAFRQRSTQFVKFEEIALDNADLMMQMLLDIPIAIMSLTGKPNDIQRS